MLQVCVESCPSTFWVYVQLEAKVFDGTATTSDYSKTVCKSGITDPATQISTSVS